MMVAREPVSGSVVAWDGEFRFWTDSPATMPGPVDLKAAAAKGAAFLLGVLTPCIVVRLSEAGEAEAGICHDANRFESLGRFGGGLGPAHTVVVFGPGVANPEAVREVCWLSPFARVLVSPLPEGVLGAAGVLGQRLEVEGKDRPRRVPLDEPFDVNLESEGVDLERHLGFDCAIQMIDLMRRSMPVCNQVMRRRGVSTFYGRVLSLTGWWSNPTFLVRSVSADDWFPSEPISLKRYAATGVPVLVKTTEAFRAATRWTGEFVSIFVASEDVHGLSTMLKLASGTCGRAWVASSDPKDVATPESMPLFRYNRAYNVGGEQWSRLHEAE